MKNKKTNYFLIVFTMLFFSYINIHSLDIKADTTYKNVNLKKTSIETNEESFINNNKINKVNNITNTLNESIIYSTFIETESKSEVDTHKVQNDTNIKKSKTSVSNSLTSETINQEINSLESKTFTLTFYSSLAEENSGYEGLNAHGGYLEYGQIASNYYPEGTKIRLDGMGIFEVKDIGGQDFNSENRIDVFIPRLDGESDENYKDRILTLGKVQVRGYVLN